MPKFDPLSRFSLASDTPKHRIIGRSVGEVGCIAGDTPLAVRRPLRHPRPMTMAALYQKFNGLDGRWDLSRPTQLQSLSDSEQMFYNQIVAVTESGHKDLVKVVFDDDTALRATPDHPVLTSVGFVEAGSLSERHTVLGRGTCMTLPSLAGKQTRPERKIVTLKYHPYGSIKRVSPAHSRVRNRKTYEYTRVPRARLVLEAVANHLAYDEFVHILNNDAGRAWTLRFMPTDYEVHHRDENPMNDAIENLEVLTTSEHARLHSGRLNSLKDLRATKGVRQVVSQESGMTYDVQMMAPAHNFCAANAIVHNTGKTHFWLTAPSPIVVLSLDRGTEGVVEQFIEQGRDIRVREYDWMTVDKVVSDDNNELQDKAIEIRDQFIADHEVAVQHARTVIWDKETDIWELFRYAHLGKPNDDPKNYAPLNQMYRRLINLAKATDVNFGCIQGLKNEWGSRVNPNSGKKQGFSTGKRVAWGFDELDGLVHVNLEHTRVDGIMGITVGKVRGPGAMKIQDQSFEGLTFPEFATQVFPDTSEGDWE